MPDTRLSALTAGTGPDFLYGIQAGASRRYQGSTFPLNVKDFGATGDGSTNDTAAIQSCFDAAFGTWASPHGSGIDHYTNRPVYFPPGHYMVKPPNTTTYTITNVLASSVSDGLAGHRIQITVASTTGLADGDVVYIRGVLKAAGLAHEANGSWSINNIAGTAFDLASSTFTNAYVSGGTAREPALRIKAVDAGVISGAGKYTSRIEMINTDGQNAALITVNGMGFTKIENMGFAAPTGCIAFDAMWDGITSQSTQSNIFQNCSFGGTDTTHCDYGLVFGFGGNASMGSENTILTCFAGGCDVAGYAAMAQNAIQNSVIGGNIATCSVGILAGGGSFPNIFGVGFQNYTITPHVDISVRGGTISDCYTIIGCRSESDNFLSTPGGATFNFYLSGIAHTGTATGGYFLQGSGNFVVDCCYCSQGYVEGRNASVNINNSTFVQSNYLTAGASENFQHLIITPQPISTKTGTSYTISTEDGSSRMIFTNAGAITVTIPLFGSGLSTGSFIDVQQGGAGKVTFTTSGGAVLNAQGAPAQLSLNGQYACGRLTSVAANTWVLQGDIVA